MPLTFRANGTGSANLIQASWFNDYHDLLTGVMQDQPVSIKNDIILKPFGTDPSSAPGGARASGSGLGIGTYQYVYTFVNQGGESTASPVFTVTTTSGNQKVNLTGIATGASPGTTSRNIYRTAVNGSSFLLCASLADNITTTYSDTLADGSLGTAVPPRASTYSGSLVAENNSSGVTVVLSKNGTLSLYPTPISVTGNTSGTATIWEPERGAFQRLVVQTSNFRNAGAEQIIQLQSIFNQFVQYFAINNPPFQFRAGNGGSPLTSASFISIGTNGGGVTVGQAVVNTNSFGYCQNAVDQICFPTDSGGSGHTGLILIEGV